MKIAHLILCVTLMALVSARSINNGGSTSNDNNLYFTSNEPAAVAFGSYPLTYSVHSSSLVTPTQQQYHTQDELGQYAYGYSEPLSAKREVHTLDGVTRGSYSYRDPDGKLQTVDYTADNNGFRVAATNLPQPPTAIATFRPQEASIAAAGLSDTVEIAPAPEVNLADQQTTELRLEKSDSTDAESIAVDASGRSLELRNSLEDSHTTANVAVAIPVVRPLHLSRHNEQQVHFKNLPTAETFIPYKAVAVIPSVYNHNYYQPLNARFFYY